MLRRGRGFRAGALRATALLALFLASLPGCGRGGTKHPEVRGESGEVTIDLRGLAPGSGRFRTYRASGGGHADFLVYRESSGAPRAALDACRTCYRWRKGYRLEGDAVTCRKCGLRFTLDGLSGGTGACVPIRLGTEARGDSLVIPVEELEAGARYF